MDRQEYIMNKIMKIMILWFIFIYDVYHIQ